MSMTGALERAPERERERERVFIRKQCPQWGVLG